MFDKLCSSVLSNLLSVVILLELCDSICCPVSVENFVRLVSRVNQHQVLAFFVLNPLALQHDCSRAYLLGSWDFSTSCSNRCLAYGRLLSFLLECIFLILSLLFSIFFRFFSLFLGSFSFFFALINGVLSLLLDILHRVSAWDVAACHIWHLHIGYFR